MCFQVVKTTRNLKKSKGWKEEGKKEKRETEGDWRRLKVIMYKVEEGRGKEEREEEWGMKRVEKKKEGRKRERQGLTAGD